MNDHFDLTDGVKLLNKDVAYLLCTAFEGGVGYWCIIVGHVKPSETKAWMDEGDDEPDVWRNYDWPVTDGGAVIIADAEEWVDAENEGDTSNVKTYRIDRESIQRGLEGMQRMYPKVFDDFRYENYDANTADVFLQCCCGFEEGIRYG